MFTYIHVNILDRLCIYITLNILIDHMYKNKEKAHTICSQITNMNM